ncbi:hypothetical protein I7I53_11199 [Histoplasma capsulatum var. duboisii H88]|uniref:Uncharacterized protein n=1 Tax=Ajellomyces capsulatus (strain H88) TaxID=544711 RepID=A0A8A1L8S7_AJEC8|nr:hypothetical protein I7I53_11199 [Histoplasma capsulatum var. duboisii H88]
MLTLTAILIIFSLYIYIYFYILPIGRRKTCTISSGLEQTSIDSPAILDQGGIRRTVDEPLPKRRIQ